MKQGLATQILPKKRTVSLVEFITQCSNWKIIRYGLLLYFLPVLVFTVIEWLFLLSGNPIVYIGEKTPASALELLYFNLITIITIGYGDIHPVSWGCVFSVAEGILGVGMFGLIVAALTTKLLSPPQNAIIFSRYGYYCTEPQRFLIIFVNTTNSYMANVDMTSYFKLGGDWGVRPSIRAPFVTTSVQTFFLDHKELDDIVKLLTEGDVFRFGITGTLEGTTYSAAIQYHADEIIMIPNRRELTGYNGFHSPDFKSKDISKMFHYRPKESLTLADYVKRTRRNNL